MFRLLILTGVYLLTGFVSKAQRESTRSITEIKVLINQGEKDTGMLNLLLEAAMIYVLRPDALKSDMDSALIFTNQAMRLAHSLRFKTGEGKCWTVYSNIYREKNEIQRGKFYAQKAIDILTHYESRADLGDAYHEMANYYDAFSKELEEKKRLNILAAECYHAANDKENEAFALRNIGDFYHIAGDNRNALVNLHKALVLYNEIKYPKLQGIYDLLGIVYTEDGNCDEAVKYGILALRTAEAVKDTSAQLCTIYNHLGTIYCNLNYIKNAISHYDQAFQLAIKKDDSTAALIVASNLIVAYIHDNQPSNGVKIIKLVEQKFKFTKPEDRLLIVNSLLSCYVSMMEFALAKPYLVELLRISESLDSLDLIQSEIYPFLISYYKATKQYKNVIRYCRYNEALCNRYQLIARMEPIYRSWYQADTALGDYRTGLQHYGMYVAIKDSLYNETKSRQIANLQIQYETEKKDKNIQILTKKDIIQRSQLHTAKLLRNVTFGGITLSIIIIILLYSRYRLKLRTNSKLEMQQSEIWQKNIALEQLLNEKEWLIKEIHHRIKNNLQTVMSLLNSQSTYLENDAALSAIKDSQHRIQAISLIHQKLYKPENITNIDIHGYIIELVEYLRECFDVRQTIHFNINVASFLLDVSQAVPIGLIINEAITNSLKYAFPNNIEGMISIRLILSDENRCFLTISDNGIELPDSVNLNKTGSLGISLMKGLAEDLDGTFALENNNGVELKISFLRDVTLFDGENYRA